MLAIFWWMLMGLIAGGLARLLTPGRQPMGLLLTMILGILGSLVGGFLSTLLFGQHPGSPGFHPGGLIMSTLGGILLLALCSRMAAKERWRTR